MMLKLYNLFRKLLVRRDEQSYSGGLWPRLARAKMAGLARFMSGATVELGCGEGLFVKQLTLANPSLEVYGIDFDEERVRQAQALFKDSPHIHISTSNALKTALPDHTFDSCFCVNTVLNVPTDDDIASIFREAHRLLKPGGTFIFDFRNHLNPIIRLQYGLVRFYDTQIKVPVRSHGVRRMKALLEQTGFVWRETYYAGIPDNALAPVIILTAESR